jgi:release factor glutamine methyltransferase
MKVNDWLIQATTRLEAGGITTARLDCLVVLEDVLNTNRTQILAHPEREITEVEQYALDAVIAKRAQHMPLAYLRGRTEFYGREFVINQHVLEPRPESETMIDLLKHLPAPLSTIVDVGTGSGALAITAKRELLTPKIYGIDIDQKCLQVAKQNAKNLDADITFVHGNLLEPLNGLMLDQPIALLCNLPYVPDNFQINTAALHEPRLAIFGGPDGLDLYRTLFGQIKGRTILPRYILAESMPPQHEALTSIAKEHGYCQTNEDDFIQLFEPTNL